MEFEVHSQSKRQPLEFSVEVEFKFYDGFIYYGTILIIAMLEVSSEKEECAQTDSYKILEACIKETLTRKDKGKSIEERDPLHEKISTMISKRLKCLLLDGSTIASKDALSKLLEC